MPTIDTCLMKKVVIPTILAATILVAGIFAMMPVQKASTVHSGIASSPLVLTAVGLTPANAVSDLATFTVNQPFCVLSVSATPTLDANANLDMAAPTVTTNLHAAANSALVNPAVTAVGTPVETLVDTATNAENICGTTTLAVLVGSAAGDAADTVTLSVTIQTRGSVAAPAAVLS